MITVTPTAAEQIRTAATAADADELALRIAARRDADGSLHYAMGFDEARADRPRIDRRRRRRSLSPRRRASCSPA